MVNNEGNAEIMGVVLLISIFVAAVALMGVTMLSAPQPEKVPAVAFDFWTDNDNTSISLIHRGGETLNLSGAKVMVVYRGESTAQDETSNFNLTDSSGRSASISDSAHLYSIGDNLSFASATREIDQVQLVWPGTGGASTTGGGGPVLIGAWSTNSSSGKNPPAAVTGAVPVTFPYASEGPTRTQPTQTPAVPWVYFIANITATNGHTPINFTDLTENEGSYGRLWNFSYESNVDGRTNPFTYSNYPIPTTWPYIQNYTVTLNLINGSLDTPYYLSRPDYISVYQSPVADFTTNISPQLEGNSGMEVIFTNKTTGYVTSLSWDFDDETTSPYPNPVHLFNSSPSILRNYTVKLTANVKLRDNPPESSTSQQVIKVHPQVIADFITNMTTGSAPLTVSFDGSGSHGYDLTYTWNFGDGNTATGRSPTYTYTYTLPGTYTVNLTVSNTLPGPNTSTSINRTITVTSVPPVAGFTANTSAGITPPVGNANLTVLFTDTSTGNPTSWLWNFGDGYTSTSQNPQHIYSNNNQTKAEYNVTLTVNNTEGGSTVTKPGFVTVYEPLVAAFGLVNFTYNAMDTVWFADQSSGYSIDRWTWNFGDGNTSTVQYPAPTNISHIYTTAGNYTVNLTITNLYGTNVSKPAFVTVLPQLVANFTANRTAGNAQLPVRFNDTSVGSGINGWSWDFGDQTTASTQNVTHTYNTAGTYTVKLTAFNPYGNNTTTGYITVLKPLVANFNGTPTVGNGQANVQFKDYSSGDGITNWTWTFGDGSTSIIQNATHLYTTPGSYNVTLTINNTYEINATTRTRYITVYPPLIANFTTTTTSGVAPLEVDFNDTSTGYDIIGWTWNFGDGSPMASLQNVSHTYSTAGTYTVTLTITNPVGSAQTTRTITVTAPVTTPTPSGAAIIGTIYNDQNGDGEANISDPKLAGWTIKLLKNNVLIATKTSDASGAYRFYEQDGVENGKKFYVVEVLPVGWQGTNPADGRSAEIHITGNNQVTTNFWNYNTMIGGGDILLNAQKPGHLVSGGYLQFTSMGTDSNIGVKIAGTPLVHSYPGDIVKIVLLSDSVGTISMSDGKINSNMQLPNAAVYINNTLKGTGQITGADYHSGYSDLTSTLAVTVPSQNVWTGFTVHGLSVIGQNDNRIINLYNVSARNSDRYFNLNVNAKSVWIEGSAGSYQLLSP